MTELKTAVRRVTKISCLPGATLSSQAPKEIKNPMEDLAETLKLVLAEDQDPAHERTRPSQMPSRLFCNNLSFEQKQELYGWLKKNNRNLAEDLEFAMDPMESMAILMEAEIYA